MSEQAGASSPGPHRHHKPKPFAPIDFEPFAGGADPARVSEAAHLAAQALVRRGRDSDDPKVTRRLVKLADEQGLDAIAEMWAESPERISVYFRAGKDTAQVSHVVAGAAEPPGAEEMKSMADAILSGAFDGEFDVALERSAAFCRVVALGQATLADGAEHSNANHASKLTRNSHLLVKTAEDLEHAANAWRLGELD